MAMAEKILLPTTVWKQAIQPSLSGLTSALDPKSFQQACEQVSDPQPFQELRYGIAQPSRFRVVLLSWATTAVPQCKVVTATEAKRAKHFRLVALMASAPTSYFAFTISNLHSSSLYKA